MNAFVASEGTSVGTVPQYLRSSNTKRFISQDLHQPEALSSSALASGSSSRSHEGDGQLAAQGAAQHVEAGECVGQRAG